MNVSGAYAASCWAKEPHAVTEGINKREEKKGKKKERRKERQRALERGERERERERDGERERERERAAARCQNLFFSIVRSILYVFPIAL